MTISERQRLSRLLIVEDDPGQLRTLADIMADEGFAVLGCGTAAEALAFVDDGSFGVAIVDLKLPDLDGTQLLQKIIALNGRVRVIIHTAYGSFDSAKEAVNYGAFAYVEKLKDPGELVRHVHRAFRLHIDRYADALELAVEQRTSELRSSEQRFRSLVEATRVIPWEFDVSSWLFTYVGPQAVELCGYPLDDWHRRFFWEEHLHPDDREATIAACKKSTARGEAHELEYRMLTADGRVIWLRDLVSVVTENGSPTRLRGVMVDVTARKQAEEKLRERDAELAHVTRLGTLGEMASELAHEINQPLYAISNFAQACCEAVRTDPASRRDELVEWTGQIAQQAHRVGEIIRRLRQYIRKEPPQRTVATVGELVADVVSLLAAELRRREVRLALDCDESLPPIVVDRVQIEQILVNLALNALDAMNDVPRVRRTLSISSRRRGESEIEITVADRGQGIGDADPEQLFQPFYTTKPSGLGMGLAIARTLIEAHDGRIWAAANARTDPDSPGMTFHFTLPISQEPTSHGN